jgi:tRNA modification GTPase
MLMSSASTIFALSSAHGRAAIAVIRASGPKAGEALRLLTGRGAEPRKASLRTLRDPRTGEELDQALVIFFPAPASETGEDVLELHVHGGRAVIRSVLDALGRSEGCRPAEPGEFARRAFENGKIDLTAAEGIADLVDAETEVQRRQAVRQAGGMLAALYERWRGQLIDALGLVEAAIDFSDEGDVSQQAVAQAERAASRLVEDIRAHLADGNRGEILREGFQVVLAGPPNVGKSSLLNALARREAAIVSAEAGTTRDIIEVRLDLEGLAVVVSDTAGLREASSAVEREGIRRTLERGRGADLVLWVMDATEPDEALPAGLAGPEAQLLMVANKADLLADRSAAAEASRANVLVVSARTGSGMDALTRRIAALARERVGSGDGPVLTQARHRLGLEAAARGLEAFLAGTDQGLELRAEDLRLATQAIGRITGRVDPEHVLDAIFGRFCIGK